MGCHALLPGDLPNAGTESSSPALQVDSLPSDPSGKSQRRMELEEKAMVHNFRYHWISLKNKMFIAGGSQGAWIQERIVLFPLF